MKPLQHTSALGWITGIAATAWLIAVLVVAVSVRSPSTMAVALGVLGVSFTIMVTAGVGAIVLHGVKQMLEQDRAPAAATEQTRPVEEPQQTVLPPLPEP